MRSQAETVTLTLSTGALADIDPDAIAAVWLDGATVRVQLHSGRVFEVREKFTEIRRLRAAAHDAAINRMEPAI